MATENRTPDDLQEAVAATLRRLRGEVRNPPPAAAERVEPRFTPQAAEEPAPLLASEGTPAEPDLLTGSEPEIPLAPTERSAMPEGRSAYREEAPGGRLRWIPYALSFAALVVFAGIVWWAYQAIMAGHKGGPVPVITADTTPAKIPPSDQTSTDTPAQQQTVYDQISGTNTQPKSEVLLPAPDTPQTPPPPPAPVPSTTDVGGTATTGTATTATPPAATTQTLIPPPAPLAPAPTPLPPTTTSGTTTGGTTTDTSGATTGSTTSGATGTDSTQPSTTADAGSSTAGQTTTGQTTTGTDTGTASANTAPEPAPYEVPTLAPTGTSMGGDSATVASAGTTSADTTATTATTTTQTSGVADNFRIQLAALKSEAEANTTWKRIRAKHGDVLGSLTVHIVKADLGAQGIYYRVQAGPFADKASAAAACDQLKTAGQQCLVKP